MALAPRKHPPAAMFVRPHLGYDFLRGPKRRRQHLHIGRELEVMKHLVLEVKIGDALRDGMRFAVEVEADGPPLPVGHAMLFGAAGQRGKPRGIRSA